MEQVSINCLCPICKLKHNVCVHHHFLTQQHNISLNRHIQPGNSACLIHWHDHDVELPEPNKDGKTTFNSLKVRTCNLVRTKIYRGDYTMINCAQPNNFLWIYNGRLKLAFNIIGFNPFTQIRMRGIIDFNFPLWLHQNYYIYQSVCKTWLSSFRMYFRVKGFSSHTVNSYSKLSHWHARSPGSYFRPDTCGLGDWWLNARVF